MFALQSNGPPSSFHCLFLASPPPIRSHELCFLDLEEDSGTACTEPQKIEVQAEGDRKHPSQATSKLCGSTVETHLSLLAGYPIESPGGIRLWVTSSVQDFQTSNVSWPFSPDVQSSPPMMLMDSKHDGQCLFYNFKSFCLALLFFPYLQTISCLLNESTKQTINVCWMKINRVTF